MDLPLGNRRTRRKKIPIHDRTPYDVLRATHIKVIRGCLSILWPPHHGLLALFEVDYRRLLSFIDN